MDNIFLGYSNEHQNQENKMEENLAVAPMNMDNKQDKMKVLQYLSLLISYVQISQMCYCEL